MTTIPTPQIDEGGTAEIAPMDYESLKKPILNRIAVAIVIVAGLLGSLAIFDSINAPLWNKKVTLPPTAAPLPMAREGAGESAEKANESVPPLADKGVPESSDSPAAIPPHVLPGEKPLTRPATGRLAILRSAEPGLPVERPPEPAHSAVKRAATPVAKSGFGLQLGVFRDPGNAEELRAKLEQNGIPAFIEARVQAGPFASRAEADLARGKLKALGITEGLLITRRK